MGFGAVRLLRQHLTIVPGRFLRPVEIDERDAKVVARLGMVRGQRQRPLVMGRGFPRPAGFARHDAEPDMAFDATGGERQRLLVTGLRRCQIALRPQCRGQVVECGRRVRRSASTLR